MHSGFGRRHFWSSLLCLTLGFTGMASANTNTNTNPGTKAKAAAPAAHATTHTITISGVVSGKQTVMRLPGNNFKTEFTYRDNGRGPDIFEDITIDAKGLVTDFKATGKSTFGAPIEETFSRVGGLAKWKSKADAGEINSTASAVYVPVESTLEVSAIITRALLRSPGNKLDALPSGQLAAQKLVDATVTKGALTKLVTLYAVTGFGFEPSYVWMWKTADPSTAGMFGVVSPGFSIIEAGWEANADALLKAQIAADDKALRDLGTKLVKKPAGVTVFKNVRWFDSEAAQMRGPSDVYVNRGVIAAVYPANSPLHALDAEATVIDGSGRTLLPGLWDMHGHIGRWDAILHMAGGVTGVRDMGNINDAINDLKTKVDAGMLIGPRIVPTGFIEGDSPFAAKLGIVVKDLDGAKRAVDWYSQNGYRQIKLYNSMRPDWIAPLTAYARERGIRVSGHIPAFMRAEEAVRAGFDEIQHINQVMLNFLAKKDDDTRTLLRFYLVGDNANTIDLNGSAVNDFVRLLVDRKVAVDPTMATFEYFYLQRQGAPNPTFKYVANNVPPTVRRGWLSNSMDVNDKNEEPFRKSYATMLGMVKKMHDAGVPILAGTDETAGFALHRELELYVQAGISPLDVLRIATWNGAKYSQVLERTGSITVGKDADLILVDGDPAKNIADVRKVSLVMKRGEITLPAELYSAVGVKPFVAPPPIEVMKPSADKK
ncbi:MAG: amidohydrolase family protein [Burkholderiales bacterium]